MRVTGFDWAIMRPFLDIPLSAILFLVVAPTVALILAVLGSGFGMALAGLVSRPGAAEEVPDRLIVGPWNHGNPNDWQGDHWHGHAASIAALPAAQLDFFEAVLAGAIPDSPIVRYFRTGSNTCHAAPDWPLPGGRVEHWHLAGDDRSLVDRIRRWCGAGTMQTVEVTLGHIGHLFAAGSRLRLQAAGSTFPRFDRNPQTGADPARTDHPGMRAAEMTIEGGAVDLPVIPDPFPVLETL